MEAILKELTGGLPDATQVAQVLIRLTAAAGLRTHMLVALGAALFVVASIEAGFTEGDVARVIQGIATGIGFIGGGAILKLTREREITGLTTAAGLWMTAAVGVAAGMGRWGAAALGVGLTWVILTVLLGIESRIEKRRAAARPSPGDTRS